MADSYCHIPDCVLCLPSYSGSSLPDREPKPDPTTPAPKGGLRYNSGKPRLALVDGDAIVELAEVLTFGAKKYAAHNWREGMSFEDTVSSMERHIARIKNGEWSDQESMRLHAAHVMCNAMFLTYYMLHARSYEKFNDLYDGDKETDV